MVASDVPRTRAFYQTVADAYALLVADVGFEGALELSLIADFVDQLAHGERVDIVDAGCGTGRMIGHLRSLSASVRPIGVDLSPAMLAHARAAHPDVELVEAPLQRMSLPGESADGIHAWYSVIHTSPADLPEVLSEFRRVLRPGGLVLLGFQSGFGERRRSGAYGHDIELHAYLHDTAAVSSALTAARFVVEVRMDRGPRREERLPQGFVMARAV